MKPEKLVSILSGEFGAANIKVCSEYHIQISLNGKNDVWLDKNGTIKFKKFGNRTAVEYIGVHDIIKSLKNSEKTSLIKMKEAIDLPEFIKRSEERLRQLNHSKAIFVDAGFKDGKSKIAAVFIDNETGSVDAKVRTGICSTNAEAEAQAIDLGLQFPSGIKIFSDSESVAKSYELKGLPVFWIPRKQNFVADSLGNLRK